MYIILSLLAGVSIVINMIVGGKVSQREGMINGVYINYLVAAVASLILSAAMLSFTPDYSSLRGIPLPYFLGGFIGVLTTYLANLVVSKLPAVYIVLLRFIGQILTSAIIDYVYFEVLSPGKIIGGVLFIIGLIINVKIDEREKEENLNPTVQEI